MKPPERNIFIVAVEVLYWSYNIQNMPEYFVNCVYLKRRARYAHINNSL